MNKTPAKNACEFNATCANYAPDAEGNCVESEEIKNVNEFSAEMQFTNGKVIKIFSDRDLQSGELIAISSMRKQRTPTCYVRTPQFKRNVQDEEPVMQRFFNGEKWVVIPMFKQKKNADTVERDILQKGYIAQKKYTNEESE